MSKVVVVTGGSSGIGAALGRELAKKGHRVVLAARRKDVLERAAKDAGDALAIVADVTKRADVVRLKDEAVRAHGHVDVWVNNVGRGINKKVLDLTDDDVDQMLAINLKSALYGMQAIVPHFQERGAGHLVNVASMIGRVPMPTFRSAYNAAKAGLSMLTANLRMDLAVTHPNVHVSLVLPGIVRTEFHDNALGGTPPLGGAPSQSADEVAVAIVACIEQPAAEVYTMPGQREMVLKYYEDVAAFEAMLRARAAGGPR
jgi:short-subunit dehydrogenase